MHWTKTLRREGDALCSTVIKDVVVREVAFIIKPMMTATFFRDPTLLTRVRHYTHVYVQGFYMNCLLGSYC